jgi:hypothetical protein
MLGASTRAASSEWLCRLRFWWGPPPRVKEIFKVSVEEASSTATCYMGSGLVVHRGKPLHRYRHWRGVFGS